MLEIRSGREMGGLKSSLTVVHYADIEANPNIRNTIEQARGSKDDIWGEVPRWDSFDGPPYDTNQYISEVQFENLKDLRTVTEIVTARMVRVHPKAPLPEDIFFYRVDGHPLFEVIQSRLGYGSAEECAKKLACGSRIGAIRPEGKPSNAFAPLAFAQILLQITEDAKKSGVEWAICQVRREFLNKVMNFQGKQPDFSSVEQTLDLPIGSAKLDRENPVVWKEMLSYPGYFLDTTDLSNLIIDLVKTNRLTTGVLGSLGITTSDNLFKPKDMKKIVPLITSSGIISDDLTCEELITLVKENVRDGTMVSLVPIDAWGKSAETMIKKAREVYGK